MSKKSDDQKFIEELVVIGKKISLEALRDKELENKIKRISSY